MVVGRNQGVHVGVCTVLRGVAVQQGIAQIVDAFRYIDLVTLRFHGGQGVPQRLKNRQVSRTADVACVGWKVEQHDGHVAVFTLAAF